MADFVRLLESQNKLNGVLFLLNLYSLYENNYVLVNRQQEKEIRERITFWIRAFVFLLDSSSRFSFPLLPPPSLHPSQ